MPSQGPRYPTTFGEDSSVGTVDWSGINISDVGDDGGLAATFSTTGVRYYLVTTNFGFTIPPNSLILGIVVEVERMETSTNENLIDNSVKLVKAGAIVGSEKAQAGEWPLAMTVATYGTSTDLWGVPWTPGEINASTFGVGFSPNKQAGGGFGQIDFIRITVHYTTQFGDIGLGL